MAKKRKKSNKNLNIKISAVIVCLVVLALVFVGIKVATSDDAPTNGPQYNKVDTSNSTSENSNETDSTDKAPADNNQEDQTKEPQKEEPSKNKGDNESENTSTSTSSEPSNPITVTPSTKGSFYDAVKYRSPDAVPADIFKHGRSLMLLNRQYELPEDFKWDLVYWANGNSVDAMYLNCEEHNSVKAVDRAAYQPLKNMFADAESAGVPLQLVSAYRSIYLQDKLFTRSVNSFISQGYSEQDAIDKANYSRTFSGTSEHNTGLGFDILQKGNFTLTTSFENTAQFKWLMENAENYGFILRYNKDKVNATGIMYEPWHFRYVGVEHAKRINELGMCLEEYIKYLES